MQFFRKFYLFFLYLNKNKIIIKLRAEAFSSDTNRLFSQIKVVNLNYPNDSAKPLMAMINYYGGQMSNELTNEKCTHVISINYDDQSNQLENNESKKFKLITPDWFTDCIEQNKLLDELIYNPKFLITNPENKDIQSRQKIDSISVEPQSVQNSTTNNQIVFKSQLILNDLVLYDETNKQCTPSPTSIKLVSKSDAASSINRIIINQQQQHQSNNELIDSSNDLSKSLSASSIQAQLENTIRLNSSNNINTNQQMPILIQQLPTMMPLVQTLVPILTNDNATNSTSNTSLNTTPPSASKQQKLKRPRKQSSGSGLSPTHNSVCQSVSVLSNQQANNNSSTFTSEMDEIFQTVLSNAANDDKKSTEIVSAAAFAPITTENKEPPAVKPIYLNLMRSNSFQFDEDSISNQDNNNYLVQENSHLIQFERCLLGCVFFIKSSESIYTAECLLDWHNVIERYGGRTVDDYDTFSNEITHVLVPNRFSNIYKRVSFILFIFF
jgi:hypothetical protein